VQVADGEPSRSDEKESSNAEMTHKARKLPADLDQVDFKAGKKKKGCDAEDGNDGGDPVSGLRLEEQRDANAKGEASERRGKAKALKGARDDQKSEDGREIDQGLGRNMHSVSFSDGNEQRRLPGGWLL
jgi:hypothetical protein